MTVRLPLLIIGKEEPSGVLLNIIQPEQNTSFNTYDIGWRRQNGWFDFVPPTNPEVIAELDYSSNNYHFLLKNDLKVRTNSNKQRFVDIDGLQEFPSTNNKNLVIIDKLTGLAIYRNPHGLPTHANRADALSYPQTSLNVNCDGVIFDDWYMVGYNELLAILGNFLVPRGGVGVSNRDTFTGKLLFSQPLSNQNFQTAFTNTEFGGTSILGFRSLAQASYRAVASTERGFYIHKAFNLIEAP